MWLSFLCSTHGSFFFSIACLEIWINRGDWMNKLPQYLPNSLWFHFEWHVEVLGEEWISHCRLKAKLMSSMCVKWNNLHRWFCFKNGARRNDHFKGKSKTNAIEKCKLTKYKWSFIMRTQSANEKMKTREKQIATTTTNNNNCTTNHCL